MLGATPGEFGIYNSDKEVYQNQRVGNLKLHSKELTIFEIVKETIYINEAIV